MKPEQFIREFGVEKAREVVEGHSKAYMPELFKYWSEDLNDYVLAPKYASFLVEDLKRLVESLDRVTQRGGLSKTKDHLDYLISFGSEFAGVSKEEIKELQQDVAVHESIYGGGDDL
ncbi:hypothetical protein Q5M47_13195 [Acinetobacter nosocomialis]|nr:hypothetical protein [Acinetobacter nosocomialis]MDO7216351.1 hypothetical protein [Acinetobacter nosocomialis]